MAGRKYREAFCPQDKEAISLLSKGYTKAEIGAMNNVTHWAVNVWFRRMKRDARARTDAHLVAIAKESGIIE